MNVVRVWPKGFSGLTKRARFLIKHFVNSALIDNLMTFFVVCNAVVMAMERHGISDAEEQRNNKFNRVFTWIFITEFVLKMVGLGPQKYVQNSMNIRDGCIVTISLVEIAIGSEGGALMALRAIRVLRAARVLRVTRLLRSLREMQRIIKVAGSTGSTFVYMAILLIMFIFIFALLGMQVYGGQFNFVGGKPRRNFDSFNEAFLTTFQSLTIESWPEILQSAVQTQLNKIISCFYFIIWIFLGNFVMLNLFLAILLEAFLEEDNDLSYEEQLAAEQAAEEAKRKQRNKEKERRMKILGKVSKKATGMTALAKNLNKVEDELIDDIDDLNEFQLREYLIELQLMKSPNKTVSFEKAEIKCNTSVYLFS
jgi:GTPase SAR1 family protein